MPLPTPRRRHVGRLLGTHPDRRHRGCGVYNSGIK
jgi:hypothetical protein